MIDIVRDQLSGSDYKTEEDPRLYVSQRTGRGPLPEDWIQNPPNGTIMCAYKLIKVWKTVCVCVGVCGCVCVSGVCVWRGGGGRWCDV